MSGYGEPWFYDSEHGAVYDDHETQIILFDEVDEADRIVACVNALAGLEPAKLAALIEACDRYTIGPAPDGCGFCREGNCSATAHVAITAALDELRGKEAHRG